MTERKASDIILGLEQKINNLTFLVNSQELLLRLINNKLTELIQKVDVNINSNAPKITIEPVVNKLISPAKQMVNSDPERYQFISSENNVRVSDEARGSRRISRPENIEPKKPKNEEATIKFPIQIPRVEGGTEIISPSPQPQLNDFTDFEPEQNPVSIKKIPVKQRVVDENGKASFMNKVEIFDADAKIVAKVDTNGMGRWQTVLPIGNYRVVIKKRDKISGTTKEFVQNIKIDGTLSVVELPMMIAK